MDLRQQSKQLLSIVAQSSSVPGSTPTESTSLEKTSLLIAKILKEDLLKPPLILLAISIKR
ncbi:hypothetical protein OSB04_009783 [Centaurea solstitialis]|uniref:Uncharacterized protein n=1 Tax=Centaurea solstitialis TaxID=347529 RepID=A0AA38WMG6_9ASTR|nr:hypothetical protein OSB04_009783 [Centaurea solstitialis]